MAVNYPTSLDTFTNPTSSSSVANPSHSQQHADANDAIEALQSKVGINNSAITTSHDYRIRQLELNPVTGTANKIEQIVINNTGSPLAKGQVVYASGSVGASGKLRITLSSNSSESTSSKTFGILAENIIDGGEGLLVTEGLLEGLDTTGAVDGDPVWLGSSAGSKVYGLANKPTAPSHLVFLGIVVRGGHANNGSIFVKIQNGFELEELHNVSIQSVADKHVLRYDSTTGIWRNVYIDTLFDQAGSASSAQSAAAAALAAHEADTTGIHGIADTSLLATKSYADSAASSAVAAIVNSAPSTLDTLNELAAALANDANFSTTITNALALKAPLASPTLTGTPTAPTATSGTNTTQIATTAFVKTSSDNAVTTSNNYTDQAVASLGNSLPTTYIPLSYYGNEDGVATLDSAGFVPNAQLNIDERIQDTAALMITSATHSNITVSYDDNTGRLSFTGVALTQEQIQDFIAPLFAHAYHTNVSATYDDSNNRIVLEGSGGGGGSGTGGSLTNSWWLGS